MYAILILETTLVRIWKIVLEIALKNDSPLCIGEIKQMPVINYDI